MVHNMNASDECSIWGKIWLFLVLLHLFQHTLTVCYHSSLCILSISDKAGARSFHPGKGRMEANAQ